MADYIYLLSTRLTTAQQTALGHVRDAARTHGMTVFLVGGAVRDLTSGSPIRDLDFAVQGNALTLKQEIEKLGGVVIGEGDSTQTLYFNFPGGVRLEVGSTLSATYPVPAKPVYSPAGILDDLRRRDFTANAMAISLNDGSYGLLMDPLNGVADIENRELRLVSNYGFIDDPGRLIRAARFSARFGWQMEEKTQQRYETGKTEGYIGTMTPAQGGFELEEIFHEEDPLRVLRRLESEGWAKSLFPAWTSSKVNEPELNRLRDVVGQLEAMGIHPDPSPAYFPLLTAKLSQKEIAALKSSFARPGFAEQIAALEVETKAIAAQFSSKAAAAPSDAWKMLFASAPEPVLWLLHTTKSAPLQARFKAFFNDWSQARQKIPYQLMQEMRITPDLPGYDNLLDQLFFAIMDQKLETPEAAKAFLEPFSPPAPPPPVNLRRRPVKREGKAAKPRSKKAAQSKESDPDMAEETVAATAPAPPIAEKPGAVKADSAKSASAKAAVVQPAATSTPTSKAASKPGSAPAAGQPGKAAAKQPAKAAGARPSANVAKTSTKAAAKTPPPQANSRSSAQTSASAGKAATKKAPATANKPSKGASPPPPKAAKAAAEPSGRPKPPVKGPAADPAKAGSKNGAQHRAKAGAKNGQKTSAKTDSKSKLNGKV